MRARHQAIIWTKDDQDHWHIIIALQVMQVYNELTYAGAKMTIGTHHDSD